MRPIILFAAFNFGVVKALAAPLSIAILAGLLVLVPEARWVEELEKAVLPLSAPAPAGAGKVEEGVEEVEAVITVGAVAVAVRNGDLLLKGEKNFFLPLLSSSAIIFPAAGSEGDGIRSTRIPAQARQRDGKKEDEWYHQ
jgi:hypothetical protein